VVKILTLCSLMMLLVVAAEAQDPALVIYLPMDEGAGDTTADLSGNGNDGKLEGAEWVDGMFGKALEFGDSSLVHIPASNSLHGDIFKGDFTLLAWINPVNEVNTWGHIWRSVDGADGTQCTLFYNNTGYVSWRGRVEDTWGERCANAAGMISAEEWTHVAVLGDGTDFRIYINGEEAQTCLFEELDGNIADYYLGFDDREWVEWFTGAIDDVYIFTRAMSEDEIKAASEGVLTMLIAVQPVSKLSTTWGDVKEAW
jgi:hypothetical protein